MWLFNCEDSINNFQKLFTKWDWKKSNAVPIRKKGDKQLLQNYCPVSLLPIRSKLFENLIFNPMLDFVEENSLFCAHKSGFRSSDSCQSSCSLTSHCS